MISSRSHSIVKLARSLQLSKARRAQGLFLAEGRNSVEAALGAGWPVRTLLCSPGYENEWGARAGGAALHIVADEVLESVVEARTSPGVVALCELPVTREPTFEGLTLVLDGVGDPGNVGTLLRAADAVGAGSVVMTAGSADPYAPKAVRASAGSVFHLPVVQPRNASPATVAALLKEHDVPGVAAVAHEGEDCFQFKWPRRCALILGNETRGISLAMELDAARVTIPMFGRAESLNVSAAGAVLLYAWRQSV